MKTSTVFRSRVTAPPSIHANLFVRQEGNTCGDLEGAYSNVQAPICSGATSICTFVGNLQGCCDDQNVCELYTTCVGLYAPETCIGSFCLSCASEAPYCVKYGFWDASSRRQYDGYSCAEFQATDTIFGIATSILGISTTSSSSSSAAAASSSTDSSSSEVPILTRFNYTGPTTSTSNISTNFSSSTVTSSNLSISASNTVSSTLSDSPISTATETPTPASRSVSQTGAIAGAVVGGLALLAFIGIGIFCLMRRRSERENRKTLPYAGNRVGEVQQTYK